MRLEELAEHKLSASEKRALDQLKRDLMFCVPQINPVLRPIGREYQEIVALLARGKRRPVLKRLSRLELTRQQLATRMTEVDDYMN
jgi:transposase